MSTGMIPVSAGCQQHGVQESILHPFNLPFVKGELANWVLQSMAAARRGQEPLNLELPDSNIAISPPPISALFLIYFDIKAGYTLGWKRSVPGIELEGVVEYKSLPSGLHTVKEDLIYFVHNDHAGLSAFINAPAGEESRNARMIAVGVMVTLSYGRLGKSWKHAEELKRIASELIVDTSKTQILEDYWEKHKPIDSTPAAESDPFDSPSSVKFKPLRALPSRPQGHNRNRSASDGTALLPPGHNLSTYHPAWSLLSLLETFGPLIFPIHRAAVLRKRILIVGHAPVEETCNFVYDISVLSNIPLAVTDLLASTAPPQRLRPLFSIGVHDIPLLEEDLCCSEATAASPKPQSLVPRDTPGCGWVACTTDSIFAMKSRLYDVLITMPAPYSDAATEKVWPKIESPQGVEMKATQRDLRRYRTLRWGLSRHTSPPASPSHEEEEDDEEQALTMSASTASLPKAPMLDVPDTDNIIESLSWSALAYAGFMWWASAGEQRLHTDEECDADANLLSGLSLSPSSPNQTKSQTSASPGARRRVPRDDMSAKQEMAIIAYFHRLTTQILATISDIVDAMDSDDEREDEQDSSRDEGSNGDNSDPAIYVSSDDIVRMGLDVWSDTDHQFVEEVAKEYFGCRAIVEGRSVDICGIRIC